jgi:acetyl esterase
VTIDTQSESPSPSARPRSRWRRRILWVVGILLALALAAVLAFTLSPWPGAMVVRVVFDRGAASTTSALEKHAPPRHRLDHR